MPVPRQPYGPGSSQVPGCARLEIATGVRDEVPPIADRDRVGIEHAAQFAVDPAGLDGVGGRLELGGLASAGRVLDLAQLRDPVLVRRLGTAAPLRRPWYGVGEGGQDQAQVAGGRHGGGHVLGALLGGVDDVDDLRLAEVAETEPEVQRGADDGDDVGARAAPPGGPW